jgi:hypothetical protein
VNETSGVERKDLIDGRWIGEIGEKVVRRWERRWRAK